MINKTINDFPYYNKYTRIDKTKFENIINKFKVSINNTSNKLDLKEYKKLKLDNKEDFCLIELDYRDNYELNQIADYFTEYCRIQCKTGNITPYDFFMKDNTKIDNIKDYRKYIYRNCNSCSNFNITVSLNILNIFKPKKWLDISAGWGDRLVSATAYKELELYVATDPNECLHPYYKKIIETLDGNNTNKYKLIKNGFNEAEIDNKFDLVFSSPPFFTIEEYSNSEEDSITKFNTLDKWINGFLYPMLERSYEKLENNGHLVLYIEDRDEIPYIDNIFKYAEKIGFKNVGSIYYYYPEEDTKYQKKPREFFVWKKIENRKQKINIELEYLKKGDINENAITMCYFTMKFPYKKIELYSEYLDRQLCMISDSFLSDWTIYLFIDDAVIDEKIIKQLIISKDNKNLSIIRYNCKEFKIDEKYHDGPFGSIIRFMPFFNNGFFAKHKYIFSTDIDTKQLLISKRDINKMEKYDIKMMWGSYIYYNKPWTTKVNILAGCLLIKDINFPNSMLINFLEKINEGKYNILKDDIKLDKYKNMSKFYYGTDEFFLNHFVYKYIKKHNINYATKIYISIYQIYKSVYYKYEGKIKELADKLIKYYEKNFEEHKDDDYVVIRSSYENEFINIINADDQYKNYRKYIKKYNFYKDKTDREHIYLIKKKK
jgi:hypothetical protein